MYMSVIGQVVFRNTTLWLVLLLLQCSVIFDVFLTDVNGLVGEYRYLHSGNTSGFPGLASFLY
jgi:hypothetical protein